MKLRTLGLTVLGAAGLSALAACKQEEAPSRPAPVAQAARKHETPAAEARPAPEVVPGGGTLRGTVFLKGTPPAPAPITPSMDPSCQGMARVDESILVKGGRLANVLVRVRGQVPGARVPAQPVIVDQQRCTYLPRVQGAVSGQPVLIKNGDGTLHNVRGMAGRKSVFNVAQPPNARPVERALPAEVEVLRFKCDMHPWMVAWVVVNPNPYFATSGEDGGFSLQGLPAGSYTVEAWHEKLGTRTAQVTVKEGESTPVSFEFSAAEAKASASAGGKK